MSMTREDVLRELELLPVWTLRAPLPGKALVEPILPVLVAKAEETIIEKVVIEMPQVIVSPAVLIASEDKKWVFVLPTELTGQAADLFNNILRALHLNKTQTSHTNQPISDIEKLGASVTLVMGEQLAQQLLASAEPIESLRGKVHSVSGLQVVVTYHPNELLQRQPNNAPSKAKTWDDLCMALDAISA